LICFAPACCIKVESKNRVQSVKEWKSVESPSVAPNLRQNPKSDHLRLCPSAHEPLLNAVRARHTSEREGVVEVFNAAERVAVHARCY